MSTIRVQALPKFPASVEAGDGIVIARSGGVFTFSVDPELHAELRPASPFTVGDLLFAFDANSFDALADVATGNVLLSGGVGAAPSYGKVGLATHVSGILPAANGGTGLSSVVFGAGGTVAYLGSAQTFTQKQTFSPASGANVELGGNTTPQMTFVPSSGSTKSAQVYQQGDNWTVAASGVANILNVNISTGVITFHQYGAGLLASSGAGTLSSTNTPTLGASGTLGSLTLGNATSGTVTLQTVTGPLGTRTVSLPAATGTVALTADKLSAFAATTSSELASVISDETGSGALVFATSPTLVAPTLGAASATSLSGAVIATQNDLETATSTTTVVSPGRQQLHPSAAKAWALITYSAGVPSVTAGYNIASVTDNGVGNLTVHFTTPFSSANFAVMVSSQSSNNNDSYDAVFSKATSSVNLLHYESSTTLTDPVAINMVAYGDQ